MTEQNIAQTIRQAIQDFVAPELRELKANQVNLEKMMDVRFAAMDVRFAAIDARFSAFEKTMDTRFAAIEKSMAEDRVVRDAQFKAMLATFDAATTRQVSDLDRRVTILETRYGHDREASSPQLT